MAVQLIGDADCSLIEPNGQTLGMVNSRLVYCESPLFGGNLYSLLRNGSESAQTARFADAEAAAVGLNEATE